MKLVALALVVFAAVTAGTYVGNQMWANHVAGVLRGQLHDSAYCRAYPTLDVCR